MNMSQSHWLLTPQVELNTHDLLVSIGRQDKIYYLTQTLPNGEFLHLELKKAGVKIHFNRLLQSPRFNPDSTLIVVTSLQLHYYTKCPVSSALERVTELNANQICRLAKFLKTIPASTPIKIVRSDNHIGISTWVLINGFVVYDLTDYDEW